MNTPPGTNGLSARTSVAITNVLAGQVRSRPLAYLAFAGPALVASIAYMDPGNFATNIQAGARYGYALLWVVVGANLLAMLFQALSAKLGIVTGRNLAETCRDAFPPQVVFAMWVVSEMAAMATDLAEFLGGAIGLSLLLHVPMLVGMAVTAAVTYALLLLDRRGFRPMEILIGVLVMTVAVCYLLEIIVAPVRWGSAFLGSVVPTLPAPGALAIAVGIVGATIMPHAIFLHSGLWRERVALSDAGGRRKLLGFSNREVVVALAMAGLVNLAMVIMAAASFHSMGHSDVAEIGAAYHTLVPLLGPAAAGVFLVALMASGISSSVVGTMAGQMIMQGFLRRRVPLWLRRSVTMLPAFVVVLLGIDTTRALILSQIVLSFALPVPMITLLMFTSRRSLMGDLVNGRLTQLAAGVGAGLVLCLNAVLLLQTVGVPMPGLPAS